MLSTFASRNFRIWFVGSLLSNLAVWMQRVAQEWLVFTKLTHDNAVAIGATLALGFLPQVLLVGLTGTIADRMDRRRLVATTQSAMALIALGLAALTLSGKVTLIGVFVLALALGVVAAFEAPARQAFLGELVLAERLPGAVALSSASFNGARLVGPGVAGVLVAVAGPGWVFVLSAAVFLAVLGSIAMLHTHQLIPYLRATRGESRLRDGFHYIRERPDLLIVLAMAFCVGTLCFNFTVYTASMTRIEFGRDAEVYGLMGIVLAVGSLIGGLIAGFASQPRIRMISLSALGIGIALLLGSLAPSIWWFAVALFFAGFSSFTMTTGMNAYIQVNSKPAMRGRVLALYFAVFLGGAPIGAPIFGWIADALGPRSSLAVGSAGGFIAALVAEAWFARQRSHGRRSAELNVAADPLRPVTVEVGSSAQDLGRVL